MQHFSAKELREEKLIGLFRKTKKIYYKKGEIIIRPDDKPLGAYLLEKGYMRIYSITADGNEKLHIIYKPTEIFPLAWILKDEQKRLYYEALTDVVIRKTTKKDFLELVATDHESSLALLQRLIDSFSIFSDRIDDLETSKTYPRVITSLLFFACHYGSPITSGKKKMADPYIIKAPITHKDIANFSAMTRETTSREMSVLEKKDIIAYKNRLIVINSIKKIQKELLNYRLKDFF